MNEFIEKLNKKLKEKLLEYINKANDEMLENGHTLDFENFLGHKEAYENVLYEIVNELAEEHKKENLFNLDYATLKNCPKCGSKAQHRVNRKGAWACGCFECNTFKCSYDHMNAIRQWEDYCFEYKGGWIPCSERLPEMKKEVLIFADDNSIFTGYLLDDGFSVYDGEGWIGLKHTLAWQPLPDPYIEKS